MFATRVSRRIYWAGLSALFISCVAAFSALTALADQEESAPLVLTFDKSAVEPGVWMGTVSGDIEGGLTTVLHDVRTSGNVWHVNFDWIIDAQDPDHSFTANLSGILNLKTGRVVMNGRIVEGHLLGAEVHEEGQLLDPATLHFEGTIRLMPATSE